MAVVITRTPWIDDDGTGTTGTVLNNAMKTGLYNEIDTALAKVAQLAGGNSFTGNQTITGNLSVAGLLSGSVIGTHVMSGPGNGGNIFIVTNPSAGAGAYGAINVGNDRANSNLQLLSYSTTFAGTVGGFNSPDSGSIISSGTNGLSLIANQSAIRFHTSAGFVERMRIAPTGEVLINATSAPGSTPQLCVVADNAAHVVGLAIMNTSPTSTLYFAAFYNSSGGPAGSIVQTSATSVSYGTASDARLKDDDGEAHDLTALRGVVVHDFTWKADGQRARGVFAQETHDVFPRAITEGTDETTDDGVTLAHPWMTDYSKFVPDLIVGWQQHDAAIAELRAALAAAKG